MKLKKGMELNKTIFGILVFFLIAVLIITLIVVLSSMQTTFYAPNTVETVVNETLARPSTAGVSLATAAARRDAVCSPITYLLNGTSGAGQLITGNTTQVNCVVYNTSSTLGLTTTMRYTYTYTWLADTAASNASGSFVNQTSNAVPIVGIVLIVILIAIIITVIISSLGFGGKPKM